MSIPVVNWTVDDYIVGNGTALTPQVLRAPMNKIWTASSVASKMYVCTIVPSNLKVKSMVCNPSQTSMPFWLKSSRILNCTELYFIWTQKFSKEYSTLLPEKKRAVALRFVGSSLVIPGSIVRCVDEIARITSGWRLFAEQHHICVGEVFVFRVHRGPAHGRWSPAGLGWLLSSNSATVQRNTARQSTP